MVLRRGQADPTILATFRPTRRQVLGRRLHTGCAVGAGLGTLLAVPALVSPQPLAVVCLLGLAVPVAVGLVGGLLGGRAAGVVVDDRGVRTPAGSAISWQDIIDVYPERSDGRTVTVLRLGPASVVRLPAPYDGRLFAHDAAFEDKLFTLRHLWETHRRWHTR
jgi:hypothetical protein